MAHECGMVGTMFDGKTLLITGGTGSFGNSVMKRFLDLSIKEIRIFSRVEKKSKMTCGRNFRATNRVQDKSNLGKIYGEDKKKKLSTLTSRQHFG